MPADGGGEGQEADRTRGKGPGEGEEVPAAAPPRISVIGGSAAGAEERAAAREIGTLLARAGAVLVTGGRGGVMEAACRGCAESGGWTVGILPGSEPGEANPWVRVPLATGMGEARNVLVVRAGEAVLAVGGSWGTLSEIAVARKLGRDVGLIGPSPAEGLDLPSFGDPGRAVDWALERARIRRGERGNGPARHRV